MTLFLYRILQNLQHLQREEKITKNAIRFFKYEFFYFGRIFEIFISTFQTDVHNI